MKNILHIADLVTNELSGIFNHIINIAHSTNTDGFMHFLCVPDNFQIGKRGDYNNLTIIRIKHLNKKIPFIPLVKLMKIVIEKKVDVIHTHSTKSYLYGGVIRIVFRKKMIYNFHGLILKHRYFSTVELFIISFIHRIILFFNGVDLVISPSKYGLHELENEFPYDVKRGCYYNEVIESNLNKIITNDIVIKDDKIKVAYIGRLEPDKNPLFAIKVLSEKILKDVEFSFYFIGEGKLKDELESAILRTNLSDRVKILGYIENAGDYMKMLDIIFLCSVSEGIPFVLWEALKSKTAVVANNLGGILEIVDNYKTGLVYETNDFNGAAACLKELILNKKLRTEITSNGFIRYSQLQKQNNLKKTVLNYYNKLLV